MGSLIESRTGNGTAFLADRRVDRLRLEIEGAVQGVGFRPFIYRLASELGLAGRVLNDGRGVLVEVEGPRRRLEELLARLPRELPPRAMLLSVREAWLEPRGEDRFSIQESAGGPPVAVILPEIATCADCLREILDPADRRYRYPFTNCTNCGPRFSILRALPYDRPNTTMHPFAMCERCREEYDNPLDRRFHAQPNACPDCGPRLSLINRDGWVLDEADGALRSTAQALLAGRIVAVKGLGGFHLLTHAADRVAVHALRERKNRYRKPLALMVRDLEQARELCEVSDAAAAILASAEAPIVLLPRRPEAPVAPDVAPENPYLGLMLPYTPLHHLLMREAGVPLVATSGNLRDEPIATDNAEALDRLGQIADLFLVHDRAIVRHIDDSVVRVGEEGVQPVRRARGYAPMPLSLEREVPCTLAVGAHLKNVAALSLGTHVFLSQHIGDMETPQAMTAFERVLRDFVALYEARPRFVACDLHPDYPSTQWLDRLRSAAPTAVPDGDGFRRALAEAEVVRVQHHHAHLASCLADNGIAGPALGVTWDGTGYGTDHTIWGGEFLLGDAAGYTRVAALAPFRLPGGEIAVFEPRRVALGLLWEIYGERAFDLDWLAPVAAATEGERRVFARMLEREFRSPVTSSAGRLFDGVASLVDLRQRACFEGEAAMALEFAADRAEGGAYPIDPVEWTASGSQEADPPTWRLDWLPLLEALLDDLRRRVGVGTIAGRFHNGLARAIVAVAQRVGEPTVALSGGCFQNRWLTEKARSGLEAAGFRVLVHRHVPPNDGGICLGQVAVAAARDGRRADDAGPAPS